MTDKSRTVEPCRTSKADMLDVIGRMCRLEASLRSKDPNTQVGACVHRPSTGDLFFGYNGFPAQLPDYTKIWEARDRQNPVTLPDVWAGDAPMTVVKGTKYDFVRHAEGSAVMRAMQTVGRLTDCELVVTHYPCHRCMIDFVLPSGLPRVYYMSEYPANPITEWIAAVSGVSLVRLRIPE